LWDLAGQDRFAVLVRPYYKDADAAVILCDLNSEDSIHAIRTWRNQLAEKFEEAMFPIVVFANKRDCLMDNGAKAGAELQKLCFELGICGWFMGSAKTGENVNECFEFIARAALKFVEKKKNDGLNEKQKAEENNLVELKLDDRIGERKDPFTGSSFQSCCFSM
jgi:GTPase KRas protein